MKPGYINVDFADVKTVMSEKGIAMMGTGQSSADERGIEAASQAVSSELLEDIELKDARGILVNITAKSPTMADFDEVDSVIKEFTADDATIIYGTVVEDSMDENELLVTVVATGVNQKTATLAVDNSFAKNRASPCPRQPPRPLPVLPARPRFDYQFFGI